jgi:hypothetical protein
MKTLKFGMSIPASIHSSLILFSFALFFQNVGGQSVIYTSYPSGATFAPNQGVAIFGPNASFSPSVPYEAEARMFSPTESAFLEDIQIPIMRPPAGRSNTFDVDICLDYSGLPGQVIESIPMIAGPQSSGQVQIVYSQLHPFLTASSTYWLAVLPDDPHSYCAWCEFSPPTLVSGVSVSDNGTGWHVRGTYPVNPFIVVGTVPEPRSEALLLFAFGSAFAFRRLLFIRSRLAKCLVWKGGGGGHMPNKSLI